MKATCTIKDDNVIYRLSEYEPLYEKAFQMCFYEQDEQGYFKSFPASYRYTANVIKRFEAYAAQMFDQLLYRIPVPWEAALDAFCQRVKGSGLAWWLTGSCAACIRGVELDPHDVDIMIDSRQCSLVEDLFAEELIEPIRDTSGWVTKDFGVLFLEARIDIASDPSPKLDYPSPGDCGPYAMAHREKVNWRGYEILVPPLLLQVDVNNRRGRTQRAEKIRAFIQNS